MAFLSMFSSFAGILVESVGVLLKTIALRIALLTALPFFHFGLSEVILEARPTGPFLRPLPAYAIASESRWMSFG
jgi:hypothetical protein